MHDLEQEQDSQSPEPEESHAESVEVPDETTTAPEVTDTPAEHSETPDDVTNYDVAEAVEEAVDPDVELGMPDEAVSETITIEPDADFVAEAVTQPKDEDLFGGLKAIIEAAIYITDEPLTTEQIATATGESIETVRLILAQLVEEYSRPDRGLTVRELAGGYKLGTKPEHHESIRQFVKKLQPPLKLSLAALETLAVIAYKQPITAPEIMEIRGVQGAGVLKTLLDRKLIATAGRKDVIGKPIMYKTTKEFLIQFGLSSLNELPTLKEFEELGRLALTDETEEQPEGPARIADAQVIDVTPVEHSGAEAQAPETESAMVEEPAEETEVAGGREAAEETPEKEKAGAETDA